MTFKGKFASFNKAKTTFAPVKRDLLCEVVDYDIVKSTLTAKRVEDGETIKIRVQKSAIERCRPNEAKYKQAKWFGHRIDDKMAKNILVGDKFVAENAFYVQKDENKVNVYETSRIMSVPSQCEGKNIVGLITLSAYDNIIKNVQVWEKKAYDFSKESLQVIAGRLDAVFEEIAKGGFPTKLGFQFRVLTPNTNTNSKAKYEVAEVSPCFDYIPAKKDGDTIVSQGTYFNSETFYECAQEYEVYFTEKYKGAVMEICVYQNFKASDFNMEVREKSREFYMSTCKSKFDKDSKDDKGNDIYQIGKNLCVNGILSLTEDDYDKKTKTTTVQNIAAKLFLNGSSWNVHSGIRSNAGDQVTFGDALKIREDYTKKQEVVPTPDKESDDDNLFNDIHSILEDESDPFNNE